MSIKIRVLLILAGSCVLFCAAVFWVHRFVIYPDFLNLERELAIASIKRLKSSFMLEIQSLDLLCLSWSSRSESADFIEAPFTFSDYVEANFDEIFFRNNRVSFIQFYDSSGKVIWQQSSFVASYALPKQYLQFGDYLGGKDLLFLHDNSGSKKDQGIAGVIMTGGLPLVIARQPIYRIKQNGPMLGTLVIGRIIDAKLVEMLSEQSHVRFQLLASSDRSSKEEFDQVMKELAGTSSYYVKIVDNALLHIYTILKDDQDRPVVLINALIPRDFIKAGYSTIKTGLALSVLIGVTLLLIVLIILERTVLNPVKLLTNHALHIGRTGDLSVRLTLARQDEIGKLSREFNIMLDQLSETRKKLMDQSYQFGVMEMAAGVLHNLRNSLNPVVVHVEMLRDRYRRLPFAEIEFAQQELHEYVIEDQRHAELVDFMRVANNSMVALAKETNIKLDDVMHRIVTIEKILSDSQKRAYSRRPEEAVRFEEIIQEALQLLSTGLRETVEIEIKRGVYEIGAFVTDRISMQQIVANLLTNAAEAIRQNNMKRGRVMVDAWLDQEYGQEFVHISIRDNGEGISEERLKHIFARRFTTKTEGATGIGLHWCANTIVAMQGRIYAESAGPGQGSCFHLLFPRNGSLASSLCAASKQEEGISAGKMVLPDDRK